MNSNRFPIFFFQRPSLSTLQVSIDPPTNIQKYSKYIADPLWFYHKSSTAQRLALLCASRKNSWIQLTCCLLTGTSSEFFSRGQTLASLLQFVPLQFRPACARCMHWIKINRNCILDVVFYQYTDKYSYFPSKIEEGLFRLPPYDEPACWSIDQVALSLWLRHWVVIRGAAGVEKIISCRHGDCTTGRI